MPTHHFPILLLEDFAGFFTACLVTPSDAPVGFAATASDARQQLKEYLEWDERERPWRRVPEFNEAKLHWLRVEVRPEYKVNETSYPSEEVMVLRVPCVTGREQAGQLHCALPTLGVEFVYQESGKLKDLVTHYVREKLKGAEPRVVARFLQTKAAALDEIALNANQKGPRRAPRLPEIKELQAVAEPLGDKRLRRLARAWEREHAVDDLTARLVRDRANVIVVGEAGTGKTAVLIEAVRRIERSGSEDEEAVEESRFKFWQTSRARLIAGMRYLGEWEARCEQVIEQLSYLNGVLCIESLLDLIGSDESGASNLARFFAPYLQRGELRIVSEATPTELDAARRLLPGFVDLFQLLQLPQLSHDEAVRVLDRVAGQHARNLSLEIKPEVPGTVYQLFRRFQPYQAFPGKAVAFLDELAERAGRRQRGTAEPIKTVGGEAAVAQFIRQTGLPATFLRDDLTLDFDQVLRALETQVIGQPAPCAAAARVITTFKANLNDPQRPLGVLLFCGPTGVGKTELARAMARYLFGHGAEQSEKLVRIDLSEYAGWDAAQRLLVGTDGEPSAFIKQVRRNPLSVVLLDEIEKASADIFDLLLNVFDEGRLTDSFGRLTIFRGAVVVMTSNLGADKLQNLGFETKGAPSFSRAALNFFRPEFFNRIDAIVQFNALSREMMRAIAVKELGQLAERDGFRRNGWKLAWTDELIEQLLKTGFDLRYGARPLQRTIESVVVAPLAHFLLAQPPPPGATVHLSFDQARTLLVNSTTGNTGDTGQ